MADVVVLPVPPPAAPTEPSAASSTAQPTALSSPPTDKDKVNVSASDLNSSFDWNSGYQATALPTILLFSITASTAPAAKSGMEKLTQKLRNRLCLQLTTNVKLPELQQ